MSTHGPSIWKVFLQCYKRELFFTGVTILCSDLASLVGPLSLNGIVTYVINYDSTSEVSTTSVNLDLIF